MGELVKKGINNWGFFMVDVINEKEMKKNCKRIKKKTTTNVEINIEWKE